MGQNKFNNKKTVKKENNIVAKVGIGIFVAIVVIALGAILFSKGNTLEANELGNVVVDISEINSKGKYYTFNHEGTKMEFFVVKDSTGKVRMAFNRCQVCYDSGRGYFIQEGEEFVCQNCGNRYKTSSIGNERGGCNPSPITSEDKTVDGTNVEINIRAFDENKYMFS